MFYVVNVFFLCAVLTVTDSSLSLFSLWAIIEVEVFLHAFVAGAVIITFVMRYWLTKAIFKWNSVRNDSVGTFLQS